MKTKLLMQLALSLLFAVALFRGSAFAQEVEIRWNTPKRFKKLAPHPRLFISRAQIDRMVKGREKFQSKYDIVQRVADSGILDAENPMDGKPTGGYMQGRILCLAMQWYRTNDRKYLEAAVKNIVGMKDALRPGQEIVLNSGQLLASPAIAYDLFYDELTAEEKQQILAVARQFAHAWLLKTGDGSRKELGEKGSWWQGRVTNWNPVCSSGAGLLGLAMYEELEESQTLIDRVDASFKPIFDSLEKNEGGWCEGLGYWDWTMHYISLFGMSYERATGLQHAGFRSKGFRQTLTFKTWFGPHGEVCGFGDNQHNRISPSILAAAKHLGYENDLNQMVDYLKRDDAAHSEKKKIKEAKNKEPEVDQSEEEAKEKSEIVNTSYGTPLTILIEPDGKFPEVKPARHASKYYPHMGWGMIADQWPEPTIYAAVRGGTLRGDHTHLDLLSWHSVIGKEKMIHNIYKAIYEPTGFGPRAGDVYERNQTSKNTLFIGGVSAYGGENKYYGRAHSETTELMLPTGPAIRMDARKAITMKEKGKPRVATRIFAVIHDKALLVLDRVESRMPVPVEARMHTLKNATFADDHVILKGEFETARLTVASDRKFVLRRSTAMSTFGKTTPATVIRLQNYDKDKTVTLASLLTRGEEPVALTVESTDDTVTVSMKAKDWEYTLPFSNILESKAAIKTKENESESGK